MHWKVCFSKSALIWATSVVNLLLYINFLCLHCSSTRRAVGGCVYAPHYTHSLWWINLCRLPLHLHKLISTLVYIIFISHLLLDACVFVNQPLVLHKLYIIYLFYFVLKNDIITISRVFLLIIVWPSFLPAPLLFKVEVPLPAKWWIKICNNPLKCVIWKPNRKIYCMIVIIYIYLMLLAIIIGWPVVIY